MSKKFHYADRSDRTLDNLLIWWGGVSPFEHHPSCQDKDSDVVLDCCRGDRAKMPTQSIESSGWSEASNGSTTILFRESPSAEAVELQPGDYLVYSDLDNKFYVLPDPGELEFNDPEDSFKIAGRGTLFASSKWKLPKGWWEPWDLAGMTAKIDGVEVKLKGVEAFASARSPQNPYSHSFAIMVSDEDAERIR